MLVLQQCLLDNIWVGSFCPLTYIFLLALSVIFHLSCSMINYRVKWAESGSFVFPLELKWKSVTVNWENQLLPLVHKAKPRLGDHAAQTAPLGNSTGLIWKTREVGMTRREKKISSAGGRYKVFEIFYLFFLQFLILHI